MNRLKDICRDINIFFYRDILRRKYYLSVVREVIFNPKYKEYTAGRIEVWHTDYCYDVDEQRFFTKRHKEFYEKVDKIEYKMLTKKKVDKILKSLEEYNEKV